MNPVIFWALRAVAVAAIGVEFAAMVAGETLVVNLAAVLGLGSVAVTWVLQQDEGPVSPRRVKPRLVPAAITDPTPGQFALFGSEEPWQPSTCTCWPPALRGCRHCKTCDTCQDCRRCAGRGCECACQG